MLDVKPGTIQTATIFGSHPDLQQSPRDVRFVFDSDQTADRADGRPCAIDLSEVTARRWWYRRLLFLYIAARLLRRFCGIGLSNLVRHLLLERRPIVSGAKRRGL
jgi:hypothetical protein